MRKINVSTDIATVYSTLREVDRAKRGMEDLAGGEIICEDCDSAIKFTDLGESLVVGANGSGSLKVLTSQLSCKCKTILSDCDAEVTHQLIRMPWREWCDFSMLREHFKYTWRSYGN